MKCDASKKCEKDFDCIHGQCDKQLKTCVWDSMKRGKQTDPEYLVGESCSDGVWNSAVEWGLDCGPGCGGQKCSDGKGCFANDHCASGKCDGMSTSTRSNETFTSTGGVCISCTDGIQNGDETDVDCGGQTLCPGTTRCALKKACKRDQDCQGFDDFSGETCSPDEMKSATSKKSCVGLSCIKQTCTMKVDLFEVCDTWRDCKSRQCGKYVPDIHLPNEESVRGSSSAVCLPECKPAIQPSANVRTTAAKLVKSFSVNNHPEVRNSLSNEYTGNLCRLLLCIWCGCVLCELHMVSCDADNTEPPPPSAPPLFPPRPKS